MGINRSRRTRSRPSKFSNAQVSSAKREAETLLDLVETDVQTAHDLYCPCCGEEEEEARTISLVEDVIGVDDKVLYEMGILYDTPVVLDSSNGLPGIEIDPDWDMVSVVSEVDWDVLSLDGDVSDDDDPSAG